MTPIHPPTRAELEELYPAQFTWEQVKAIIVHKKLPLLGRHKALESRYQAWGASIKEEYGNSTNYLLRHRLQWGKPDSLVLIPSTLDREVCKKADPQAPVIDGIRVNAAIPTGTPPYFTAELPPSLISIIRNDWPYSVPVELEHWVIWIAVPIVHPSHFPPSLITCVKEIGLFGFTGGAEVTPSACDLNSVLPAIAHWGHTEVDLRPTDEDGTVLGQEEKDKLEAVVEEISRFVKRRWKEEEWEVGWWVNPIKAQSILDVAHIHVLARYKQSSS